MTRNISVKLGTVHKHSRQTSISIACVQPASLSEWDLIWHECEYSTYFHSREWAEIWSNYTKGKMFLSPFLVLFSDGKKALLPFSCSNRDGLVPILLGKTKSYISSPECTYGGWISNDKLDNDHVILLSNLLKKKFTDLFWRLNPYDETQFKSGIAFSDAGETHAINLTKGFDFIASKMSGGHRRAVKQAIRYGVSARIASSIEDWLDYYQVYEASVSRWGNSLLGDKYLWGLFREIFKRNSPNVELWLSIYQDKVISGALCFHSRKHFVAWCGGSIDTYFNLRPVHILLYEIMKNSCEKGYTWFDFNPSAGLEGVKAFKESFGAQPLECPIVNLKTENMRTIALSKVNDKVVEIKKRTHCDLSVPIFKNFFNED